MNPTLIDACTLSASSDILRYMSLGLLDLSSPQQQKHVTSVLEKSIYVAYTNGGNIGYDSGYENGYEIGYQAGLDAGN